MARIQRVPGCWPLVVIVVIPILLCTLFFAYSVLLPDPNDLPDPIPFERAAWDQPQKMERWKMVDAVRESFPIGSHSRADILQALGTNFYPTVFIGHDGMGGIQRKLPSDTLVYYLGTRSVVGLETQYAALFLSFTNDVLSSIDFEDTCY